MRRKTKDDLKRWGRAALEAAPIVAALSRSSHPIAWVAAAVHVWDKVAGISGKPEFGTASPWKMSWRQQKALLAALVQEGIGRSTGEQTTGDVQVWEEGGVSFGWNNGSTYGPVLEEGGDPRAPIEALWVRCKCFALSFDPDDGFTLARDEDRETFRPSERAKALGRDCARLKAAGHHVGVLLDGPPGTGKSAALAHVAEALGGRVIRASLRGVPPLELAGLVSVLRPDVVLLDDVDRGPTDHVLDALDRFAAERIAVLATSNDASAICPALLRAGRIDDLHSFGAIEPDTLQAFAPRLLGEDLQAFSHLTVSEVARYLSIRDTLGPERARGFISRLGCAKQQACHTAP